MMRPHRLARLISKVTQREMTEDFAVEVLRGVFRENALKVFPALCSTCYNVKN